MLSQQDEEMLEYITNALESTERELFIVMQSEIERTQKWLKGGTQQSANGGE